MEPMKRRPETNSLRSRPGPSAPSKIRFAIATILGGTSAVQVLPVHAADTGASSDRIQEVIVTAQRRSENAQSVPINGEISVAGGESPGAAGNGVRHPWHAGVHPALPPSASP